AARLALLEAQARSLGRRFHPRERMLVRAEAATPQPEPYVDRSKSPSDPAPLLWHRQREHAVRPRSGGADELIRVGVAADDAVHEDDVVRPDVFGHEVADYAVDLTACEELGGCVLVAA